MNERARTSRRTFCRRRRALTLLEALVSVTILAIVTGLVIVGSRALLASQNRSAARQQIALIADAVDRYAAAWPRWEIAGVVLADKGWPDHIAGRLFAEGGDTFAPIPNFNDFPGGLDFDLTDPVVVPPTPLNQDSLSANICLTYALTASSNKGPHLIVDDTAALLQSIAEVVPSITNPLLPAPAGLNAARQGTSGAQRAKVLVDPWGTPYRYFWVYRDFESNLAQRAYKGFLPVDYGAFLAGSGAGGADNPQMFQPNGQRKTAIGFVIESAGPDRTFGNVWKVSPTAQEINAAADNLIRMP